MSASITNSLLTVFGEGYNTNPDNSGGGSYGYDIYDENVSTDGDYVIALYNGIASILNALGTNVVPIDEDVTRGFLNLLRDNMLTLYPDGFIPVYYRGGATYVPKEAIQLVIDTVFSWAADLGIDILGNTPVIVAGKTTYPPLNMYTYDSPLYFSFRQTDTTKKYPPLYEYTLTISDNDLPVHMILAVTKKTKATPQDNYKSYLVDFNECSYIQHGVVGMIFSSRASFTLTEVSTYTWYDSEGVPHSSQGTHTYESDEITDSDGNVYYVCRVTTFEGEYFFVFKPVNDYGIFKMQLNKNMKLSHYFLYNYSGGGNVVSEATYGNTMEGFPADFWPMIINCIRTNLGSFSLQEYADYPVKERDLSEIYLNWDDAVIDGVTCKPNAIAINDVYMEGSHISQAQAQTGQRGNE